MAYTDEQLGEALDALIAARQSGQSPLSVPSEVSDEAALANHLLTLAEHMLPFAAGSLAMSTPPVALSTNHLRRTRSWLQLSGEGRSMPRAGVGLRRLVLVALVVLTLGFAAFAIPETRALAQDILQLFRRADSDTIEVILTPTPSSPLPQPTDASTTAEATPASTQVEVATVAAVVEPTPISAGPGTLDANYPLTVEEAAAAAGFPVQAPISLPNGFEFRGARLDANHQAVEQYFVLAAHSGPFVVPQFTLVQQPGPFDSLIGPSAVIDLLMIGATPGEYVAGGWLYEPSGTEVDADGTVVQQFTWEQTMVPLQTLRWTRDAFYFEIAFIGSDTQAGYLAAEDLVAVAVSLR